MPSKIVFGFSLTSEKIKAWLRCLGIPSLFNFPPPSSPPEKMVNVTLANYHIVKYIL